MKRYSVVVHNDKDAPMGEYEQQFRELEVFMEDHPNARVIGFAHPFARVLDPSSSFDRYIEPSYWEALVEYDDTGA